MFGEFRSVLYVSAGVSRFISCDRNYDGRQGKTQLCRRLLNLGVHVLLKGAVNEILQVPFLWLVFSSNGQIIV